MSTIERARALTGYDEVSRLRQAQDLDWVLDLAPAAPSSLADLGCGTGTLLAAALERWPELVRAVGVDGAASRVDEAARRLGADADVRRGDLLALEDTGERFDLITSTSVLHWLHPDERRTLAWVAAHLRPGGAFLLTTHHPHPERDGLGAEDAVALEALAALGAEGVVSGTPSPASGVEALRGVVPMSVRARPAEAIHALLSEVLDVDAIEERYVTVETAGAAEYAAFHASTFGTYFSRLVPEGEQERFFAAVGEAAWRRQRERGAVYPITVRLWRARPRTPARAPR